MAKVVRSNQELNGLANGKELVTNGDFSLGTVGWTAHNSSSLAVVGGNLRVTNDGAGNPTGRMTITGLKIGTTYEIRVGFAGGNTGAYYISNVTDGFVLSNTPKDYVVNHTAIDSVFILDFVAGYDNLGQYMDFTPCSVKEIPQVQGENLPDYVASRSNYGFKNHIINGGFDVWQRGTSFIGNNFYASDRCYAQGAGAVTVSRVDLGGGVYATRHLLGTANAFQNIIFSVENGVNILAGKTLTFSIRMKASSETALNLVARKSSTGSGGTETHNNSLGTIGTGYRTYSVTFTLGASDATNKNLLTQIDFVSLGTGGWIEVSDVQLEEGSVATPFEKRPYGLELSLCQRYYEKLVVSVRGTMYTPNGDTRIDIPFSTTKRISNPSCIISTNAIHAIGSGSAGSFANVDLTPAGGLGQTTANGVYAMTITNPAVVAGSGGVVTYQGHANSEVYVDAELY